MTKDRYELKLEKKALILMSQGWLVRNLWSHLHTCKHTT